jgi:hypothetical protein
MLFLEQNEVPEEKHLSQVTEKRTTLSCTDYTTP